MLNAYKVLKIFLLATILTPAFCEEFPRGLHPVSEERYLLHQNLIRDSIKGIKLEDFLHSQEIILSEKPDASVARDLPAIQKLADYVRKHGGYIHPGLVQYHHPKIEGYRGMTTTKFIKKGVPIIRIPKKLMFHLQDIAPKCKEYFPNVKNLEDKIHQNSYPIFALWVKYQLKKEDSSNELLKLFKATLPKDFDEFTWTEKDKSMFQGSGYEKIVGNVEKEA